MTSLRILVLTLLVLPGLASATGNTLLKQCSDLITMLETQKMPDDSFDIGMCGGYLKGIRETNGLHRVLAKQVGIKQTTVLFCIPQEVSIEQLARVVVKFMKENPENLHEHEIHNAWLAFKSAFPCE